MFFSISELQMLFMLLITIQFNLLLINADQYNNIHVQWLQNDNITNNHSCILTYLNRTFHCSLGENGVTKNKVEGDGYSPEGIFPLREAYYRIDRLLPHNIIESFPSFLELNIIHPHDGWCDDSLDVNYNKYITLPYSTNKEVSFEHLWLIDSVAYDLFVVIGYNDDPIVPYLGSAIFFHITETYGSTAGCIALNRSDLIWVISNLNSSTQIIIEA